MHVTVGVSPYVCSVEAEKLRGIPSSNIIVLITDRSHTVFCLGILRDHPGITLENHNQSLLCKVYGDKIDDTALLSQHMIISNLF